MGLASTGFCHLYRMGGGRESILTGMRCSSILKSPISILPRTVLTCLLPRGHTEPNHTSRFLLPCPQSNTYPRQTNHLTASLVLTPAFSSPAASGGSWWRGPRIQNVFSCAYGMAAHSAHCTALHCTAPVRAAERVRAEELSRIRIRNTQICRRTQNPIGIGGVECFQR